jgi:apolipoprotein N-acyltransferase
MNFAILPVYSRLIHMTIKVIGNKRFLLRIANSGISGIIEPDGSVEAQSRPSVQPLKKTGDTLYPV